MHTNDGNIIRLTSEGISIGYTSDVISNIIYVRDFDNKYHPIPCDASALRLA